MKETTSLLFVEKECLHKLKHYLPAQAPLKDFVHHNTLHAFQQEPFEEALQRASVLFGFNTGLSLQDYKSLYYSGRIKEKVLQWVLQQRKGPNATAWKAKLLAESFPTPALPRIGQLRSGWKKWYQLDMDSLVQPILFRTLCSYLDQGISIWSFPVQEMGFLAALRQMEQNGLISFFRQKRSRRLLLQGCTITELLAILVGNESWYEQYLFDQQFSHSGWSGLVSAVEDNPVGLLDARCINLHDVVVFELLLEIDALDDHFKSGWQPLCVKMKSPPVGLFDALEVSEQQEAIAIWQHAFEWSYYDEVLKGLQEEKPGAHNLPDRNFQALFCMDDRECSLRRHLENYDPFCETFGTPGFFGVAFYYQPQHARFHTKLCPAPVSPTHLVKEVGNVSVRQKDMHFSKHAHSFHSGWLIAQTLGFWSAIKLFVNIFKPSISPATALSFRHMDKNARLTIEATQNPVFEEHLQVGFTIEEMQDRVEAVLRSIGLVKNFASIVYVIGHGASSVNNPHYSAYDCGACCGRPGSVNARVFSIMANHSQVRQGLRSKGIDIPESTQFVGALHDTTRDEILFFDEETLGVANAKAHIENERVFAKALESNARERARRFESVSLQQPAFKIHEQVRRRSVSLFEPRPELNHATNAIAIVGRRQLTRGIFLDRRSFLNSYDYRADTHGDYLYNILKAVAPVAGGINLEYYFSRVDNQKLGAGTKLPHNVMGLFGVANGIDGDLRPGLPSQMVEVHEPVRLLVIVERDAQTVLEVIQRDEQTHEWFMNQWVHLVAIEPESKEIYHYVNGVFEPYLPLAASIPVTNNLSAIISGSRDNLPVYLIA